MEVEHCGGISVENEQSYTSIDESCLKEVSEAIKEMLNLHPSIFWNVSFVELDEIRSLNRSYLGCQVMERIEMRYFLLLFTMSKRKLLFCVFIVGANPSY